MKRKDYQKPTMDVVKLQHQTHLLQASPMQTSVSAQRSSYGEAIVEDGDWE